MADMESAVLAQNDRRLERGSVRVMNSLIQAENAVRIVTEPGLRRSCYAFGVLDRGSGFAIQIHSWAQARLLSKFHPDMVFRLFSNPAEAHQFSLEREGHMGGLAFEYLARYPEFSRVFRIEHALGDDTDSIIEGLQRGPTQRTTRM